MVMPVLRSNICSAEKDTKRSSNTLLRLVSFSVEQTLCLQKLIIVICKWYCGCYRFRPGTFESELEDIKCSELQDGLLILTEQLTAANSLSIQKKIEKC